MILYLFAANIMMMAGISAFIESLIFPSIACMLLAASFQHLYNRGMRK